MKHLIVLALLFLTIKGQSQEFIRATETYTNLYTIKTQLEPYFENQLRDIGEAEFYHEGSEYLEYKKFVDYWEPLVYPHGNFSTYFQNEKNYWVSGHPNKSPGNIDPWRELGPTNDPAILSGVGPVEFITINENNYSEMLAGSLSGGLYYSNNGAGSWVNAGSDSWENSGCQHAIFHPTLAGVIYACTNKKNSDSGPSWIGMMAHVKRKTGALWETIGDYADFGGEYNKYYKLLADPLNTNRLYLATLYGLYYSDNSNAVASNVTWTKMTDPLLQGKIYDIEFVPNQTGSWTDKIVVTVYSPATKLWNVVYTNNYGLTWQILPNHPIMLKNKFLTIEPTKANSDMLYIYTSDSTSTRTLYRFNWTSSIWTNIGPTSLTGNNYGSCHAFGASPLNPDRLAINKNTGITITSSGGTSWTLKSTGHADVEDIVWRPRSQDTVFVANHGGVYKSTDGGANFISANNGLGVGEVFGMSGSQTNPGRIAIGLYHDNSMVSLNNYLEDSWIPGWHSRHVGDGLKPEIDYQNPDKAWLLHQYNDPSGLAFFTDITNNSLTGVSIYDNTNFRSASPDGNVVLNTADPSIVYFTYSSDMEPAPSANRNQDIARASGYGLTGKTRISNFSLSPHNLTKYTALRLFGAPTNSDVLYAQVVDETNGYHKLYRTTNANATTPVWALLGTPSNEWISDIDVSPENPNIIYVSYTDNNNQPTGNGLEMLFRIDYTSTNNYVLGGNAIDLTGNLPAAEAGKYCTVLEKGTNEGIYFATNAGVYFSNATMISGGTKDWVKIGTNSPHVIPSGLEINYQINNIRISYNGRGVWEHDLYCPATTNVSESGTYLINKFVEVSNDIISTAVINNGKVVDYRAGNKISLGPGFVANPGSDFNAFIHRCNSAGNSFKTSQMTSEDNANKIVEPQLLQRITIYPNPTNNLITVQINQFDESEKVNYKLTLYNSMGKKLQTIAVASEKTSVDLSMYDSGIYFLSFNDDEVMQAVKIIKSN